MNEWVVAGILITLVLMALIVWRNRARCSKCGSYQSTVQFFEDRLGTQPGSGANYGKWVKVPMKVCSNCHDYRPI